MSSLSRIVPFETLNKNNYKTWKMQMKALLVRSNTWAYVNGECPKPDLIAGNAESEKAVQAWIKKDEKAKSELILSISSTELNHIEGCSTSREVWLKLKHIYQPIEMIDICEPPRKVTLLKELLHQKMTKNGDVKKHVRTFFDIVMKLVDMKVEINHDLLAVMLLYSLPSTFGDFRCVIESQDKLPSLEVLYTKIIEEDTRKAIIASKARRSTQKKTPQSEVRKRKNNPVSAVIDTKKRGTSKGNDGLGRQIKHKTLMLHLTNLH